MNTTQQEATSSAIEDFTLYTDLKVLLSEERWGIEWEKPIEFDQVKPLEMPLDVFPTTIKNMILDVTKTLETPPDLQAMFSLGVLATALQSKVTVSPWNSWKEPVCLYTASFLPASSKKSASFNIMCEPIKAFQLKIQDNAKKLKLINDHKIKALQKVVASLEKKYVETQDEEHFVKMEEVLIKIEQYEVNELPLLMLDNATEESLILEIKKNKEKLAILTSEGSLFDKLKSAKFDTYKSEIYLKAYSNDSMLLTRIMRQADMLYNPHLTISIAAQPTVIEAFPRQMIERGFLPRFLLSLPYDVSGWREGGIREGYDDKIVATYNELVTKLLSFEPKEAIKLTYSKEAQQHLVEYERWHERNYRGDAVFANELKLWGGKFIGQLVRISGLMHVVNQLEENPSLPIEEINTVIDEKLVSNTLSLVPYFIQHTQIAYKVVNINEELLEAEHLFKKILLSEENDVATHNDVWQKVKHRYGTRKGIDTILQILIDRHYIKKVDIPSKNNKGTKDAYIINPYVNVSNQTKHH